MHTVLLEQVNVIGPECVMDPVSFMEREVSQLLLTNVEYKDRLFIGNVHLVGRLFRNGRAPLGLEMTSWL